MQNQLGFVLKVFLLSAGLSVLIKYILPNLSIPATATNALIIVFLPIVIMTSVLLWRFQRQQN
ncbi:MAG: hypothetical protein KME30_06735 [Iphinoe sp. HA4291-MV1]|nr:hypothetical protein [Iphinoe sp. HA4291-MV1]